MGATSSCSRGMRVVSLLSVWVQSSTEVGLLATSHSWMPGAPHPQFYQVLTTTFEAPVLRCITGGLDLDHTMKKVENPWGKIIWVLTFPLQYYVIFLKFLLHLFFLTTWDKRQAYCKEIFRKPCGIGGEKPGFTYLTL